MVAVHHYDDLRIHRLAVQLYTSLIERHGIHHEHAEIALRLVEATKPEGIAVAVAVGSSFVRPIRYKGDDRAPKI
ncbi:MAG: hypothetical protein LAO79_14565 [Acidobacteriia bacterium]|nr:hypothetical protein [Terriglobia bacterium]